MRGISFLVQAGWLVATKIQIPILEAVTETIAVSFLSSFQPQVKLIMSSDEGKLFVGGLSFDTSEQALEDAFSKYGQISEVVVIKDRETQKSRGFGFVTFENPDEAKDAMLAMNGKSLDGRQIRVDQAGKSGGGGRSGGGFRGGSGGSGGGYFGSWGRGGGGRGGRGFSQGGGRYDNRSGGGGYQERGYYNRDRNQGGYGNRSGGDDGGW